ncbi:MAG: bifunctional DNA-formamidopyrimidine glycosylase/DNA-(apurinic or apyrimidinic site) lyase [Erysipelothrix sp.]|nr:bifunctional DNA-formamidopyrimidine glycosylase/DNA-(apurinic or apyrimidinic site) lyase [Erysipelothrix sp.]
MPELPEVETIKNVLEHNLKNKTIEWIRLDYAPLLESKSEYKIQDLSGLTFKGFQRRGKYLIFNFDNGMSWVVHLRMEGKFHLYKEETNPAKHTHLMFKVDDTYVHYLDTRKFSRMAVIKDLDAYFKTKNLGYEPFDEALSVSFLKERFKNRKRAIKSVLLDQSHITGIGNIYADEILFRCKIHPEKPAFTLTDKQLESIIDNTIIVLKKAIEEGGTTIRSYTSSLGVTGLFQVSLKAYGREGLPCTECQTSMTRIKVGGRSTVFCEKCQKE